MKQPPLLKLITEMITWRRLLFNRFTILAAVIVIASIGAVAYVDTNDDGHVQGRVVDSNGNPVQNATVTLREIPLEGVVKSSTTKTDAEGRFEFVDKTNLLEYRIKISVDGEVVASEHHHLYFKGENQELEIQITEE
ncbi:carboxypeptidase-like regulatory domain-containing protein [Halopelagius fulvigenes]|uniref:Carboxypeptidase-like regulatory domain-containing protein n=1 Tax=Halopelagius fulvigenes TaxID=1198324 RepID=A0ABD5U0C6_9EURY